MYLSQTVQKFKYHLTRRKKKNVKGQQIHSLLE